MLTYLKTNFLRLLLLIFLLFLFPLCACAEGLDAMSLEVQTDQTTQAAKEDISETKKVGIYTMVQGEDAIIRGKDDSFCKEFLKNLQEFEHEDFMACGMKFSPKYPEYRNLEWVKLDAKENKERLERFILSGLSRMSESAKVNAFNRMMDSLLNGTTVAMEASIEGLFKYWTDPTDGRKIKIGLFSEQKNKILKISRSECPEGNANYAFLLDADGQDLEEFAPPFSRNESGEGFNAGGNFFYYKDRLMNVTAEIFPSRNNYLKADGRLVVGDVFGIKHLDAEGNIVRGSVAGHHQCEYIWSQIKK